MPDGWHICDGTNGTPDLRGRFVLGNSASYAVGTTGGSETVELTVEQMPKHAHAYYPSISSGKKTSTSTSSSAVSIIESSTSTLNTTTVGSSQPHPNMPPYYVLAYIMKL